MRQSPATRADSDAAKSAIVEDATMVPRTRCRFRFAAVVALACSLPSLGAAMGGHLDRRVKRSGPDGLCFERAYDAAHMRRHPRQTVEAVTVLLKPDAHPAASTTAFGFAARIKLRGVPEPAHGMATCWWEEATNRDVVGRRVYPELKSDDATRCMSTVEPGSAEEAGDFMLDADLTLAQVTVYNGFSQMRFGPTGARVMRDVRFGRDDLILKLRAVARARCDGIEAVLAEPVRVQSR
jgi:hypothetical protein